MGHSLILPVLKGVDKKIYLSQNKNTYQILMGKGEIMTVFEDDRVLAAAFAHGQAFGNPPKSAQEVYEQFFAPGAIGRDGVYADLLSLAEIGEILEWSSLRKRQQQQKP